MKIDRGQIGGQTMTDNTDRIIVVNNIEEIKADFFDTDIIIPSLFVNYRINVKGKRFYARIEEDKEIRIAPSYSAIRTEFPTSYFLQEWRGRLGNEKASWIFEHAAHYGTYFHVVAGRLLKGEHVFLNDDWLFADMESFYLHNGYDFIEGTKWYKEQKRDIKKDIFGFVQWTKDYKVKPIAIEYPCFRNDNKLAGTLDLVCKLTIPKKKKEDEKEIVALTDFKTGTGFYDDYIMQLYGYTGMWDEEQPELKIDKFFNWAPHNYNLPLSSRVTPYKFKDQTDNEILFKKFDKYVELFHLDSANMEVKPYTGFNADLQVSLETDTETVFQEIDVIKDLQEIAEKRKEEF